MSSRRAIYKNIQEGIENDLFKAVRLVKVHPDGNREILLPYSKIAKDAKERLKNTLYRFEHIKMQLEKKLAPGTYIIEAKTGLLNSSMTELFEIVLKNPITFPIQVSQNGTENKDDYQTTETEEMRDHFDIDELKDLYRENATLKACNEVLELKVKHLEQQLASKEGLSDEPKGMADSLIKNLAENVLPVVGNIFDEFLKTKRESIALENRKLDLGDNGGGSSYRVKSRKPPKQNREVILEDMNSLYDENPEDFEATLADIKIKDPALYDYLCDAMQLEFEDEDQDN